MVKKLLLFGLFLFLVWCNNNWRLTSDGWKINNSQNLTDLTNWNKESIKRNFKLNIARQNNNEYNQVKDISKSKDSFSVLKEELDKEFSHIYSPNDSNHYENSCYLLLDVDYKDKQFVLYRNKWAGVGSWWCKLDWVERIWVMWIHNQKPDPEGEYILKSYDKETGLFKYVMSKKYWNLWDWENEYEFRFYLKNGKVIKEKVRRDIDLNEFRKIWIVKIIKDKCWVEDFDVDKIPTKSWESIDLDCNNWKVQEYSTYAEYAELVNRWNWFYDFEIYQDLLGPAYHFYIKDGEIIDEWYDVWCKSLISDIDLINVCYEGNNWECVFIFRNNASWFKYSWYYVLPFFDFVPDCKGGYFLTVNNDIKQILSWASFYDKNTDNTYTYKFISWNTVILFTQDGDILEAEVKYFNTKYWKSFLLFNSWSILQLDYLPAAGWNDEWLYKTFFNWKEVK